MRALLGARKGVTLCGLARVQEAAAQVAQTPNEPCANFAKTFTDCMSDSNADLEACRYALRIYCVCAVELVWCRAVWCKEVHTKNYVYIYTQLQALSVWAALLVQSLALWSFFTVLTLP